MFEIGDKVQWHKDSNVIGRIVSAVEGDTVGVQ